MTSVHELLLAQRFLPEPGGSIRWMYEVYRRWPVPVDVVTHDYFRYPPPGRSLPPASSDAFPNLHIERRNILMSDWGLDHPANWSRYARMTLAVARRLRRLPPGHLLRVHAIHAVPEVVSLLPLKRYCGPRLRIVCYAHGEEICACRTSRQLRFFMRRAHAIVDLMIANSRFTATLLRPYIDPAKVYVIHPGVDLSEFARADQAGQSLRQERGWQNRHIILTLARLEPRKNHAAVLQTLKVLLPEFPDLLYLIAGDGSQRAVLEQMTRDLGLADHVLFLGAVDGPTKIALYGACDIFAMPAIQYQTDIEGFGLVFLEAAAAGRPAVAGNAGGQAEAVLDGRTGFVIDGTDPRQLLAVLRRLLANPTLRQQMGSAARQHAQNFDWPRIVQETWNLLASHLEQ